MILLSHVVVLVLQVEFNSGCCALCSYTIPMWSHSQPTFLNVSSPWPVHNFLLAFKKKQQQLFADGAFSSLHRNIHVTFSFSIFSVQRVKFFPCRPFLLKRLSPPPPVDGRISYFVTKKELAGKLHKPAELRFNWLYRKTIIWCDPFLVSSDFFRMKSHPEKLWVEQKIERRKGCFLCSHLSTKHHFQDAFLPWETRYWDATSLLAWAGKQRGNDN